MSGAAEYSVSEVIDKIGSGCFQYRMMLVTGLLWTADCMEIMILSLIAPDLKCEMGLTDVQIASLTTVVFAGNSCPSSKKVPVFTSNVAR